MMLSTSTPRQVAESYWQAEARRDLDAVMEHFHPDAVLEVPDGKLMGRATIRTFYEPMFEQYPNLEIRIARDITNGEWAALEYDAVLIDADGGRTPLQGCNIVRVVNGQFTYLRGYFDPSQLG